MPIIRNINQIFNNNDPEIEQLYTEYKSGTLDMNTLTPEQKYKLNDKISSEKMEQIKQMIFKSQTSTYKPAKRKLKFRFNT
ncbi:MAG: hypothetical protein MJ211_09785 [Bacteroidales bacterium]|nr:hypothetical protein [Bacteroidales bacterium]